MKDVVSICSLAQHKVTLKMLRSEEFWLEVWVGCLHSPILISILSKVSYSGKKIHKLNSELAHQGIHGITFPLSHQNLAHHACDTKFFYWFHSIISFHLQQPPTPSINHYMVKTPAFFGSRFIDSHDYLPEALSRVLFWVPFPVGGDRPSWVETHFIGSHSEPLPAIFYYTAFWLYLILDRPVLFFSSEMDLMVFKKS